MSSGEEDEDPYQHGLQSSMVATAVHMEVGTRVCMASGLRLHIAGSRFAEQREYLKLH